MHAVSLLSPFLLNQFSTDGYAIVENFISDEECMQLQSRMEVLTQDFSEQDAITSVFSTLNHQHTKDLYFLDSAHKVSFFFEEDAIHENQLLYPINLSLNKVGHELHQHDPIFRDFCHQDKMTDLVKNLGYDTPVIRQSMYIFKQPHIGGPVAIHQDSTFLHTLKKPVIGLWFALEDATRENGCLWAIPGGHKTPLRQKFNRNQDNSLTFATLDPTPYEKDKLVPLEVKKGTVIALHGYLPHSSERNTSSQSRHAFTLHFTDHQDGFPETNWIR